jgi:aminoglycoside phosphotransferase family enzyme/predicted kinase
MTIPTERIIKELSRPGAYPHPVDGVEVIQTHISVVFLAGDLVYKIKKPVDFGFLDFTTLEKRLHFCLEELHLNRRLSPGIYLGVAQVADGPEGLYLQEKVIHEQEVSETRQVAQVVSETKQMEQMVSETGPDQEHHREEPHPEHNTKTAVEYAVVMKRLDESRLLSSLLRQGSVDTAAMEAIAKRIAVFHTEALTSPEITRKGGTQAVIFNTEEDFQQIEPYVGDTLSKGTFETIVQYTRTFMEVNTDLFAKRDADGWIRDGHGDLHTQHICMTDGIQIFDCIEFNERFRYGDVLVDAAFLSMDLERLGFKDLADVFTASYLAQMEQIDFTGLFNFYACYRAVVRGKVEGFRYRDPDIKPEEARTARENARNFFLLGEKYSRTLVPPFLIAGCGLMGSGKSTLAGALRTCLDIEILSSDSIRKELADIKATAPHHVPFGSGIYSHQFSEQTYSSLHQRAMAVLKRGQSVFLDASYMSPALRKQAMGTARKADARFLLLYLDPGEEELRSRLRKRMSGSGTISDGREEILSDQMRAFNPPAEVPGEQKLTIYCSLALYHVVRETYRRLLRV